MFVYGNLKSLSTLKEDVLEDAVKMATMCCTDNFMVVLSLDGNMYSFQNEAEKLVCIRPSFFLCCDQDCSVSKYLEVWKCNFNRQWKWCLLYLFMSTTLFFIFSYVLVQGIKKNFRVFVQVAKIVLEAYRPCH